MNIMLKRTSSAYAIAHHQAFPFQSDAVNSIAPLEYSALFHEQGLGKTKIALDLVIQWLREDVIDTALIVTKKSLVENWVKEAKSHTSLRPIVLTQNRSNNYYSFVTPARLYITHYEVSHSERSRLSMFARSRKLCVILDEAHKIKNPHTNVSKALHRLSQYCTRRVIMTGTPVANRPYDIWSPVYFLDRGLSLGKCFETFKREMDIPKTNGESLEIFQSNLSNVYQKIRPFAIRETKLSAGLSLPTKYIVYKKVEMEPNQREMYDFYKSALSAEVVIDGMATLDDADEILKRLLRLVQVSSNPKLVDEQYTSCPGKFHAIDDVINERAAEGPKTVIWTSFRNNVIELVDRYRSYQPAHVHGGLSIASRCKQIDRFMEDDCCRVLVATTGAAKEGLTLTKANYAVFLDRSFNLDDYLQAQDRIHRISQEHDCTVEVLVATNTIDEWIDELLRIKLLAGSLLQGDTSPAESNAISLDKLHSLFSRVLATD